MPRFEPFAGIRYDPAVVALADVIAPPYDAIDTVARDALERRSPFNSVRLERSAAAPDAGPCPFDRWRRDGVLVQDDEPGFYVYRIGYHDEAGRPRQTAGVLGALGLSPPGEGDVLPHERTLAAAGPRHDRPGGLQACGANVSPVWVLSPAVGLSGLCEQPGPPDARATDEEGNHHRLWRVTSAGLVEAIAGAVASAPAVIADGHHRFEAALAHREERRAATAGRPGDYDLLMAYAVELAEEQLTVRPIHRLVAGLPAELDLLAALDQWFEPFPALVPPERLGAEMADAGAIGLFLPAGMWLLRPRPAEATAGRGGSDAGPTDAGRLVPVLAALPSHRLDYDPDPARLAAAVAAGVADAGFVLRPPTVAEIAAAAMGRRRMPEKTTSFHPKPRTGLVFRRLLD